MAKHAQAYLILGAIIGMLMATLPEAMAADQRFTFSPDKGVTVEVTRIDATHVQLRNLSSGKIERELVTEGNTSPAANVSSSFEAKDFNFDGHADLTVVTPVGMVNDAYDIFLYRPESQDFERLRAPMGVGASCDELEGVTIRPRERVLLSSCRSGPAWYTDAYRFNDGGRLYLYGVSRLLNDEIASHLCPVRSGAQPGWLQLRFDQAGNVTAEACQLYQDDWKDIPADSRIVLTVGVPKLPLHDAEDDKPPRRHLVKGDAVEIIGVGVDGGEWLEVRYQNLQRSSIVGWIRADEAGLLQSGSNESP
jgi:hypothetical protein